MIRLTWHLTLVMIVASLTSPMSAQSPGNRPLATREDLETLLTGSTLSTRERTALEQRLAEGDFRDGDRMVVRVVGNAAFSDTFPVRAGLTVTFPNMPPLQLRGTLRSELEAKVIDHIRQFVRDPQVTAEPLIRIGVVGAVVRPGYYNIPASIPLADVVMLAGGLAPEANFKKTTVVRGTETQRSSDDVQRAIAAGLSLDQLGFQGGDNVVVARRGTGLGGAVPILGALAAILLAAIALKNEL